MENTKLDLLTATRAQLMARDSQGRAVVRNDDANVVRLFSMQLRNACAFVARVIDKRGAFKGGDDDVDYVVGATTFIACARDAIALCFPADDDELAFDSNDANVVDTCARVLNECTTHANELHTTSYADSSCIEFDRLMHDDDA